MARTKKKTDETNPNPATDAPGITEATTPATMAEGETAGASTPTGPTAGKSGDNREGKSDLDLYGYRAIYTCRSKGFEMGENRRFNQRVFKFDEKPEPEVLARLKAAGYVYRGIEKAWTVQATPVTRLEADRLAMELSGNSVEMESGGMANGR